MINQLLVFMYCLLLENIQNVNNLTVFIFAEFIAHFSCWLNTFRNAWYEYKFKIFYFTFRGTQQIGDGDFTINYDDLSIMKKITHCNITINTNLMVTAVVFFIRKLYSITNLYLTKNVYRKLSVIKCIYLKNIILAFIRHLFLLDAILIICSLLKMTLFSVFVKNTKIQHLTPFFILFYHKKT